MPIPVVLDTNSLLLPFQRKLDLPSEIERLIEAPHFFVVLQQCVDELNEMAQHKRKFSPAARAALTWISKRGFVIEKGFKGRPDDAMLEFCLANGAMLVS